MHACRSTLEDPTLEHAYSWYPVYFPAFHPGIEVAAGDVVEGVCGAALSDDGVHPDYRFHGRVVRRDGEVAFSIESPHHGTAYCATPFYRELFRDGGVPVAGEERPADLAGELRLWLERQLPDYMVPATVSVLDSFPLTPAGKVDRRALPRPQGAAAAAEDAAPRTPAEESLAAVWREVLRVERVGVHDNFFALGGDSILSLQVVARARAAGLRLTPSQVFEHPTVAELAVLGLVGAGGAVEDGPASGEVPLTPVQLAFFANEPAAPHHFNQTLLFEVPAGLAPAPLARAVGRLLEHHDSLRLRFVREAGSWRQSYAPVEGDGVFTCIDLAGVPASPESVEAAAAALQASLDLAAGPLVRVALFNLGAERPGRLLLVVHHLVVDGVSWRILLEDLASAWQQESAGLPPHLPARTASFQRWAAMLAEQARALLASGELEVWAEALAGDPEALPQDGPGGPNTMATVATVATELSAERTRALLRRAPAAYYARAEDLLLAALAAAFAGWTGRNALWIDLESHGREEISGIDLTRTVGWLTALYPVRLALAPGAGPGAAIRSVKEQMRAVPGRGLGYGLLRFLAGGEAAARLAALPQPEVGFTYLGRLDAALPAEALFVPATESAGPFCDPALRRRHLLEVGASVVGDRLRIDWSFSRSRHRRETVEGLAARCVQALGELIDHCLGEGAGGHTPSDFPLARLDQAALDRLVGAAREVDVYPLSPMQQGMLFHSLYEAASEAYFEQAVFRLRGPLDAAAFHRAWQRVVDRHAALRTSIHWRDLPEPLQVVRTGVELPWREEDWRGSAPAERAARLEEHRRAARERGFDLAAAPLLAIDVLRTGDGEHHVVWSFHHLLFDGWCFPLLLGEVLALYSAFERGEELSLPQPRPYRDYIAWLRTQDMSTAEGYWRRRLAGFTEPTRLEPGRRVEGWSERAADYAEKTARLTPAATAALRELAQGRHLTLSTVVAGAWALLLRRWSGRSDVVFGMVVSGRPPELAGVESMVGLFINSLPVRAELRPDETAAAWLARLQSEQVEMRRYEHTPLAAVQGWSEVPPGEPLFHTLLAFESYPVDPALAKSPTGLRIESVEAEERTSYPFTLSAVPGDRLLFKLTYDRRFDAAAVERLLGHLELLLEGLARHPGQPLGALPWMPAAERHQLLVEWTDTATAYGRERTLTGLFAEQAARAPEAVAVVAGERSLRYGELLRAARQLAGSLRRLGVGRGHVVGLAAGRTLEMVTGLLGILEAGAAYLPLDAALPRERRALLLRDADVEVLLADREREGAFAGLVERLVRLDAVATQAAAPEDVREAPAADDPAYLMYTSGSTGLPKGVVVPHRAVVRLVRETGYARFDREQVFLHLAPGSFDASTLEIWGPLLNGGRLVLYQGDPADVDEIGRALADHAVTALWLTAGLFRAMVDGNPDALGGLRQLLAGGDVLSLPHVRRVRERFPGLRLINGYGPTEGTTFTCCETIGSVGEGPVPIGRPVANTTVQVLDGALEPVPLGAAGELCIGGDGLALGYARRPELTAERFVPAPAGGRLYRTGDLVRWLGDGRVEFLGRLDQQVKIRGFRVEPGEVEAALRRHPGVREAVVLPRGEGADRRLVAYVVPVDGHPVPAAGDLRGFLQEQLPDPFIPSVFVALDSVPLTPNGKVDHRALPAPEQQGSLGPSATWVLPGTPTEEILAAIWSEVLGRSGIGADDNFFELGGDSIASIQVVARARQRGLALTPKQLFEHPTVAGLAAVVGQTAVAAEQGEVAGPLPLLPAQRWFFAQEPAEPHHFNQALLFCLRERVAVRDLAAAAGHLTRHHDALRTRFTYGSAGWLAHGAPFESEAPFTVLDLSALPEERRRGALEMAAASLQASLDLERPLLRIALFTLGPAEPDRLLLAFHHLVVDAVSWRILLEDLETALRQLAAGEPVRLPAKTTSVRQWAEELVRLAGSDGLASELERWLEPSAAEAAPLPVDGPGDPDTFAALETATAELPANLTRELLEQAADLWRARVDELLLAALAQVLSAWTGGRGALVDLEGHGREEEIAPAVDLTRTVGWLTAIYPVLLEAPPGAGPEAAVRAVKERLRRLPWHGIGYGLLRHLRGGDVAARLARLPRPEVGFNYLGQLDGVLTEVSLLAPAEESAGASLSPRMLRPHVLEVTASVLGGRLRLEWGFNPRRHRRETVEALARSLERALEELLAHGRSSRAPGWSPSDFPLARLDQAALDHLLSAGAEIEDVYPLSPLQQGLLFESLSASHREAYFEQLTLGLRGRLDAAAFRRAWQRVLERHPVLRTSFHWEGLESPLQVVHRAAELSWQEESWSTLPPAGAAARLDAFRAADRDRGFDLSRAPLLRCALVRTGEEEHRFVWSFHHLLIDGWCLSLLLGEVFALYQAFREGVNPALPRPRPYRDYIAWLAGRDRAQEEAYWRGKLAGFDTPVRVELDSAVEDWSARTGDFLELRSRVPAPDTQRLAALVRQRGWTLSTLVQAAWALVLSRWTGRDDVVFGSVVAGRPPEIAGVESMVGLFINTLPVRVTMAGAETVADWLGRLQDELVEMRQHEQVPLVDVQGWSQLPPGEPLFHSLFSFQNYPLDTSLADRATDLEVFDLETSTFTNVPLVLVAVPHQELLLSLRHDRRHDAAKVLRLLAHVQAALQAFAARPECPVADLVLLPAAERHQALCEWNDAAAEGARELCLQERFALAALQSPEAPALVFEDEVLTYGGLDRCANRLAHRLIGRGVGSEVVVGICAERSAEMVVGMLAILKAGGAYLPLDPALPGERLGFMLQEAGARVVLAQERLRPAVAGLAEEVLPLDGAPLDEADGRADDPGRRAHPENLAYVLFTSGSTGRPKGVAVEHRQVLHYLDGVTARLEMPAGSSYATVSTFAADLGNTAVFPALAGHGCLHVIARERLTDPQALAEGMRRRGVDLLKIVPSHLSALLAGAPAEQILPRLRLVLGGEALGWDLAERLRGRPGLRVLNHYGPTEATVGALTCELASRDRGTAGTVPIGRPLANVRVYLLDAGLRPVPLGVEGELCLAGDGLTRGYLGRPELTAERFLPEPFSGRPGERLYRTGDRARFLPDGNVEFRGRIDHQVKIRGFRVELTEIETVLRELPEVGQAVVVARPGASAGETLLVAYVVPAQAGLDPHPERLAEHLGRKLPDYMLPAAIVRLDALPLTPNGKLDRQALPAPEAAPAVEAVAPPRDLVELQLVQIWEDLLGVRPIGVNQDFFTLGGNSISVVRLLGRIFKTFGRRLTIARVVEGATVERLAALLRQAGDKRSSSCLVPLQPGGAKPPLFCVHPSGGGILCYVELARCLGPDQPLYGLQAPAFAGEALEATDIESMASRYLKAVREVQPAGPYHLAGWSMGGTVAYEMACQLATEGEEVRLLALLDSRVPDAAERQLAFDQKRLLVGMALELGLPLEALGRAASEVEDLDVDEQLPVLLEEARRLGLVPPDLDLDQIRHMLRLLEVNGQAVRRYVPRPYGGRVSLFRARDAMMRGAAADPSRGWSSSAVGGLDIQEVRGDHFSLLRAPHVEDLAERLQRALGESKE